MRQETEGEYTDSGEGGLCEGIFAETLHDTGLSYAGISEGYYTH